MEQNDTTLPKQFAMPPSAIIDEQESEKPIEQNDEDEEVQRLLIPFDKYPKLKKWVQLFTDQDNRETYGNRTESAMQAYNCKDRIVAASIGYQNFRKLQGLASIFVENKGITIEKIITVLATRAITSENPKWFEMFTEMMGIRDPKGASVVINNVQQNNTMITDISDEEKKSFNEQFREWVKTH